MLKFIAGFIIGTAAGVIVMAMLTLAGNDDLVGDGDDYDL